MIMKRQPVQVLVIPFRRSKTTIEYCLLKRSDGSYWQFVAGGAEGNETPLEAAKREAEEEAGISPKSKIVPLDSQCCVPANIFPGWEQWPKGTYVVREFAFGIEVVSDSIKLSNEHTECQWKTFDDAMKVLMWDSNKTALWELSQRLSNSVK